MVLPAWSTEQLRDARTRSKKMELVLACFSGDADGFGLRHISFIQ